MKEEIFNWLKSERNYQEGVALYNTYGYSLLLKKRFSSINTPLLQDILLDELCKLVDTTPKEVSTITRKVKPISTQNKNKPETYTDDELQALAQKLGVEVDELLTDEYIDSLHEKDDIIEELEEQLDVVQTKLKQLKPVAEETKRMLSFRDNFPFLREKSCPDELKILVSEMFTSYDNYRSAHQELVASPDNTEQQQTFVLCKTIITEYLNNRSIWDELEHYKASGTILGTHPLFADKKAKEQISTLSDMDLIKKLNNCNVNISKAKKANDPERLSRWSATKELVEKEIASRNV